jgi:predicted transcriptional regulator
VISRVIAEMGRGPTTVKTLSRKLKVEPGALEAMLAYLVRKGLVRELRPECRPKGCRGCPYNGKCQEMPVVGYQLVEKP